MDRRDFLTAKRRKKPAESQQASRRITSGINPYSGPWTENEIVHLLKRTMFGAKKEDVDYFKSKTVSQTVNELLNPTAPQPSPPLKEYVTTTTVGTVPDTNILQGTTWITDINNDGTVQSQRRSCYRKWWTGVMINHDRSIREKLQMFWVYILVMRPKI